MEKRTFKQTFLLHSLRHRCSCSNATDLSESGSIDLAIVDMLFILMKLAIKTKHPHKYVLNAIEAIIIVLFKIFFSETDKFFNNAPETQIKDVRLLILFVFLFLFF